jgi:hypothetical protein
LKPESNRTPLAILPEGKTVAIIERDDTWTKVAFSDIAFGRRIGYVATGDLVFESAETEPVPNRATPTPQPAQTPQAAPTPPAGPTMPAVPPSPASLRSPAPQRASPSNSKAVSPVASTDTKLSSGPAISSRAGSALSDSQIAEALALGGKEKGQQQGLVIRDSEQGFANALSTSPGSHNGFELRIYTPARWIRQLAANAAKEYRTLGVADISEEDRRQILRVFVEPDTPTHVSAAGVRFARSAQHVVLKNEQKTFVVQPISKEDVSQEVSNAMGGRASFSGLRTSFDMNDLREVRGKDGEFFVVVIGDKGSEREFKIKDKHFKRLD